MYKSRSNSKSVKYSPSLSGSSLSDGDLSSDRSPENHHSRSEKPSSKVDTDRLLQILRENREKREKEERRRPLDYLPKNPPKLPVSKVADFNEKFPRCNTCRKLLNTNEHEMCDSCLRVKRLESKVSKLNKYVREMSKSRR